MLLLSLTTVALGAVGSWATPATIYPTVVHEKRDFTLGGWSPSRKLDSHVVLPMRIGLKQQNLHRLEEFLVDVSHPDSPNYGKHWSAEKIADTFAPSLDTIDSVRRWLHSAGFSSERVTLSASKGWLELNATVAEVESLLNASYYVFSQKHGAEHIACDSYSVPEHVQEHIEIIHPTVNINARIVPRSDPKSPVVGAARQVGAPVANKHVKTIGQAPGWVFDGSLTHCDEQTTPDCLRALYKFYYRQLAPEENSYAISEFTPQAFLQEDLDNFFRNYSRTLVGHKPRVASIDGGAVQTQQQAFELNGESDLDLEYAMSLVAPLSVDVYQAGDIVQGASFNNLLDALDASYCTSGGGDDPNQDGIYPDTLPGGYKGQDCGKMRPANVISTSYGAQEPEMTAAYQIRQCNEYGKLGMMGVTILFSSGDDGVAGFKGICVDPATGQQSPHGTRFNPDFPANCPFVTAVGATQIKPGGTVHDPEMAAQTIIYSGGGFSDVFPIPGYQKEHVERFFEHYPPPYTAAQYNNSRKARGYPDLSVNGVHYVVRVSNKTILVYGTSCSTPVVGSMIASVNDARLAVGKSPVGFINPTIYSNLFKGAFNDIISGNNPGCGTQGFTSVPGWDPVTGLGTPNFERLLGLWLVLP